MVEVKILKAYTQLKTIKKRTDGHIEVKKSFYFPILSTLVFDSQISFI